MTQVFLIEARCYYAEPDDVYSQEYDRGKSVELEKLCTEH